MPYSYTQYTGDGVTSTYSIPFPYIHNSHIKIKVDDEATTDWGWVGDATVRFERPPTRGASILIYRQTPLNNRFVDFQNGAGLDEHDLDLDSDQLFYIQQEMSDWGLTGEFAPAPEETEPNPLEPTNLTVIGGFRSLHITWVNPFGNTLPHTEILVGENSDRTQAKNVGRVQATTHSVFDLDVLRTYWVWVRAVNVLTGGSSAWVGPVAATTKAIEMEDFLEPIVDQSAIVDALLADIDIDAILSGLNTEAVFEEHGERLGEIVLGAVVQSDEDYHYNITELTAEALRREALTVRAGENEAAVVQNAQAIADVDGNVRAQWTIQTQAIGNKKAVAGIGLLADGQTGTSEFTVLADKFFIYNPADGTPKKVFQLINNQAYLIGDLIATGTIQGDKINAQSTIQLADGGQLLIGTGGLIQLGNNIYMDGNRATFRLANFQLVDTDLNGVVTIPFEKREDGKIYMKDVIADKATISEATIAEAVIGVATIDTLHLKNNAVTTYAFVTGGQTSTWNTLYGRTTPRWYTVPKSPKLTVTNVVSGRPAMLTVNFNWLSAEDYAGTSFGIIASQTNYAVTDNFKNTSTIDALIADGTFIWSKNAGGGDWLAMSYGEQFQWLPNSDGTWYFYVLWKLGGGGDADSKWNTYLKSNSVSVLHMKR